MERLDVVAVYANPVRWRSRLALFQAFEQHMLDSGVRLTTVECAYGERPYDLPDREGVNRVRVRAATLVWNKECLINIGISRLPENWKYVAWIDADVYFRQQGWASEAVHALQQYAIIQPWKTAYDLGPNDEHLCAHTSFCHQFLHRQPIVPASGNAKWWHGDGGPYTYPHSGYAWCATRNAINCVGGLIEIGAMGAGDHHMALALVGEVASSVFGIHTAANERGQQGRIAPSYMRHLALWQERALRHINKNIGYLGGTIEHHWHGRKNQRGYMSRWGMFVDNSFDPDFDLKKNSFGVVELAGNKPELANQLDRYFRERNEDCNSLS